MVNDCVAYSIKQTADFTAITNVKIYKKEVQKYLIYPESILNDIITIRRRIMTQHATAHAIDM